jgi:hypothetical protein
VSALSGGLQERLPLPVLEALQTVRPIGDIVVVYLLFRMKQLIADYLLQTDWMARGKGRQTHWLAPLLAHAGTHALGTAAIALVVAPELWWLAVVDLLVHASIDRVKAVPALGGRWRPDQAAFWWSHGVDQEAHNLTHLVFVIMLVLA